MRDQGTRPDLTDQAKCRICSAPYALSGTLLCDRCWELERRIQRDPGIAFRILSTGKLDAAPYRAWDLVIRLCHLAERVFPIVDPLRQAPNDCFCGQGGFWGSEGYGATFAKGYRNTGLAADFIEQAVAHVVRLIASRPAEELPPLGLLGEIGDLQPHELASLRKQMAQQILLGDEVRAAKAEGKVVS